MRPQCRSRFVQNLMVFIQSLSSWAEYIHIQPVNQLELARSRMYPGGLWIRVNYLSFVSHTQCGGRYFWYSSTIGWSIYPGFMLLKSTVTGSGDMSGNGPIGVIATGLVSAWLLMYCHKILAPLNCHDSHKSNLRSP